MSVRRFLDHLRDPSPAFRCYVCGDAAETLSHVRRVENVLRPAATEQQLDHLRELFGSHARPFVELFSHHNGMTLYRNTQGVMEVAGLWINAVEHWEGITDEMKVWWDGIGYDPDERPLGIEGARAFAQIPDTPDYFTVMVEGSSIGSIFFVGHDDVRDEPFADSLDDFLAAIVDDPAEFMNEMGCNTRYCIDITDYQLIPKLYVANYEEPTATVE